MNNYQQEILGIFGTAKKSINLAVSWFTDETLIDALIEKAPNVKVNVLLSADLVNLWRFRKMAQLSNSGATIRKIGSDNALNGNFMHGKFFLIDDETAFGGSYNFTANARTNNENFGKLATFNNYSRDYSKWWSDSSDFFEGYNETLADRIIQKIKEESAVAQKLRQERITNLVQEYKSSGLNQTVYQKAVLSAIIPQPSERENIIQAELQKDDLRNTANSLVTAKASINARGQVITENTGTTAKPHKFYGGTDSFLKETNRSKKTYSIAAFQKHHIEKNYGFLRCEIKYGMLICIGELQPENCDRYKIRIEYREGIAPQVFILSPHINPRAEIHMYNEGSLCLFYPKEFKWTNSTKIADYTIPWIVEWVLYYELWKATGKWEGAEQSH